MCVPTKKEYENALENINWVCNAIRQEKRIREDLINKLCNSQHCLNSYDAMLSDAREVVQKYEIYRELIDENE